jgi:superfamily II DNA/RNA helicase
MPPGRHRPQAGKENTVQEATFLELGASSRVVETLSLREINAPFAIQTMVMPDALAGHDVLARSRTGSGKTLAFAIPIVERLDPSWDRPSALVLVPTRELAVQVKEEFADVAAAKGLAVAAVYGGVSITEQSKASGRAHILIATPGRMEDLAQRKLVRLGGVRILVLDEADRMLDMGFQPQVDRIVRRIPAERQTMFFSATLEGATGNLARAYTRDARLHEVESAIRTVDEAEHRFVPVTHNTKLDTLIDLLSKEGRGLALVFVRTRLGADRLVHKLKARDVRAMPMHGDMTQQARERALARFQSGQVDTLVATDVAARGLDVDGITHVVNFDPPEDDNGYLHRVGRTARAGRSGTGVTLVLPEQQGDISRVAARLMLAQQFEAEGMKVAPPRIVYQSRRGRRSLLAGRPRRRA